MIVRAAGRRPVAGRRRAAASGCNELDDEVSRAVDDGDERALLAAASQALADAVREHGEQLAGRGPLALGRDRPARRPVARGGPRAAAGRGLHPRPAGVGVDEQRGRARRAARRASRRSPTSSCASGRRASPATARSLVRNVFVSVDPYMRSRMTGVRTYVGAVRARRRRSTAAPSGASSSRGTTASPRATGCCRGSAGASRGSPHGDRLRKLDPSLAPPSTALGVLGMPGLTAWVGLVDIGRDRRRARRSTSPAPPARSAAPRRRSPSSRGCA